MGSYLLKKEEKINSGIQNMILNKNNINWLRKQVWAWILLGIFIMSVFFYIAKGLIVIVGGTVLGIYLYGLYGKDDPVIKPLPVETSLTQPDNTMFNTTVKYMKHGVNALNNVANYTTKPNTIEGFEGQYKLFSNIWWKNSR